MSHQNSAIQEYAGFAIFASQHIESDGVVHDVNAHISKYIQSKMLNRLAELGYADGNSADWISAHVALAVALGRRLDDTLLPLFLGANRDNFSVLAEVALSIKSHMDELADSAIDVRTDLSELVTFLAQQAHRDT